MRVADLIGRRAVTPAQADHNRKHWPAWRLIHGLNPRDAAPGLTYYREAVELWAAVERGEFPPPTAGPWGLSWPRADVTTWANARRPRKSPGTH